MPHTIRTDRLLLRPPVPRDARPLARALNDWDIVKETESWGYPVSEERTRWRLAQYARQSQAETAFFVMVSAGAPIGTIGLHARIRRSAGPIYGLGYMIGKAHWAQGYVSEAARALCAFGFSALGADLIEADVFQDNPGSSAVLRKSGFRFTGDPGPGWSATRGGNFPRYAYELTRQDLV